MQLTAPWRPTSIFLPICIFPTLLVLIFLLPLLARFLRYFPSYPLSFSCCLLVSACPPCIHIQAKIASLDDAGFYDPFHAERARQGADKMNNISEFTAAMKCLFPPQISNMYTQISIYIQQSKEVAMRYWLWWPTASLSRLARVSSEPCVLEPCGKNYRSLLQTELCIAGLFFGKEPCIIEQVLESI